MLKISPRIRRRRVLKRMREEGFSEGFFSFSKEELIKFYEEVGLDIDSRFEECGELSLEDAARYMIEQGYTEFDTTDLAVVLLGREWVRLDSDKREKERARISGELRKRKYTVALPSDIAGRACFTSTNCFRYAMGAENSIIILRILGYDLEDGNIVLRQDQDDPNIFNNLKISRDDLAVDVRLPKRNEIGFDEGRLVGNILALASLSSQLSFSVRYARLERFIGSTIPLFERVFNTGLMEYPMFDYEIDDPRARDDGTKIDVKSKGRIYRAESDAVMSWVGDYLGIDPHPSIEIDFTGIILSRDVIDGLITGYLEYRSTAYEQEKKRIRTAVYIGNRIMGENLRALLRLRGFSATNLCADKSVFQDAKKEKHRYQFNIDKAGTLYYNDLIGRSIIITKLIYNKDSKECMKLTLKKKPKNAKIIVGFPGYGLVGTIAIKFLIEHLDIEKIGSIESSRLLPLAAVHKSKLVGPLDIFYNKKYNLVVIQILSDLGGVEWEFSKTLLQIGKEIGSKEIMVLEGMPAQSKDLKTFYYSTKSNLDKYGIAPLTEGVMMGATATLLLNSSKMPITCIFAESHSQLPDSEAAAKIIEKLDKYLGLKLDYKPLLSAAKKFEDMLKEMMEKSKQVQGMPTSGKEPDKEPSYIG
jgi:uncharacterized protein